MPATVDDSAAITVALVDDYDVVLIGVTHMFDQYRDRIVVAEIDTNKPLHDQVDIVLYDSFAQTESDHGEIGVLVRNPSARRVVVSTWNFHPDLIDSARRQGAHGYLSKALHADLSEPQHGAVLHPRRLPEDPGGAPDPGGAVGREPRLQP